NTDDDRGGRHVGRNGSFRKLYVHPRGLPRLPRPSDADRHYSDDPSDESTRQDVRYRSGSVRGARSRKSCISSACIQWASGALWPPAVYRRFVVQEISLDKGRVANSGRTSWYRPAQRVVWALCANLFQTL